MEPTGETAADSGSENASAAETGPEGDASDEVVWLNPVWGTVTSGCGRRLNPILGTWEVHEGVDISVPTGTEVAAVRTGYVTECRTSPSYGKLVKYVTEDGYTILVAHLSEILVEKGETVEPGQVIALSGNTGWTTGPHLHYGIWQGDTLLDPLDYLYLPLAADAK